MTCRSEGGFSLPEEGVAGGGVRRGVRRAREKQAVRDGAAPCILATLLHFFFS